MAKIKKVDTTTLKKGVGILALNDTFQVYISVLKAAGRSVRTIAVYQQSFNIYQPFFHDKGINFIEQLDAAVIRDLLALLADKGHSQGGVHMVYRNLRAFLRWAWDEYDITTRNPIEKVTCSERQPVPIPGFTMDEIEELIKAAKAGQFPQRGLSLHGTVPTAPALSH